MEKNLTFDDQLFAIVRTLKMENFEKFAEPVKVVTSLERACFRVLWVPKETIHFFVSAISVAANWETKRSKPENFHFTWWGHRRSLNIPRRDASLSYTATLSRLEKSSRVSEPAKRDRVLASLRNTLEKTRDPPPGFPWSKR